MIPMSLNKTKNLNRIHNFFIKQFFRNFPLYWFSILLIVIITAFFIDIPYSLFQIHKIR